MSFEQIHNQIRQTLFRKPRLLAKAGRCLLRNTLRLPPRLRAVDIMINEACNCQCEHCCAHAFTEKRDVPPLSLTEMVAAIEEFRKCGAFIFSLLGGEPFLCPDLEILIKACKPTDSYVTIVTNGAAVTTEQLKQAYRLGVDKIAVSIDSSISQEHDRFRGLPGCHERAMKTLRVAREIGLTVGINVTVTNESLHTKGIQDLFAQARKERISTDINIPHPIGRWDGRTDLLITEDNVQYLEQLRKEDPLIHRDLNASSLGPIGCGCVKDGLYMSVYGDVFPCIFMCVAIGNIRRNSVSSIRRAAMAAVPEFKTHTSKCLAGEDRSFIGKYVSQGFGVPKPADGERIFGMNIVPSRCGDENCRNFNSSNSLQGNCRHVV